MSGSYFSYGEIFIYFFTQRLLTNGEFHDLDLRSFRQGLGHLQEICKFVSDSYLFKEKHWKLLLRTKIANGPRLCHDLDQGHFCIVKVIGRKIRVWSIIFLWKTLAVSIL